MRDWSYLSGAHIAHTPPRRLLRVGQHSYLTIWPRADAEHGRGNNNTAQGGAYCGVLMALSNLHDVANERLRSLGKHRVPLRICNERRRRDE